MKAIRARVDRAHELGLEVVGEMMRLWNPEQLYVRQPEWQELTAPDAEPQPASHKSEWPHVTGCWNSGFGDFCIAETAHFAEVFALDGLSLDGFGCWSTCYCAACRAAYSADTGLAIPYSAPQWGARRGFRPRRRLTNRVRPTATTSSGGSTAMPSSSSAGRGPFARSTPSSP